MPKTNIVLELHILQRSYIHEYKYELNLLFYTAGQLHVVDRINAHMRMDEL